MHNETYATAVLAERARERERAMHLARLHYSEPPRSARRMRFSIAWFPRLSRLRYRGSVARGTPTPPAGLPTSTTLG
jgi:hypothetical protein